MRTIIAGTRTITDYSKLELAIQDSGFSITTVLCGGSRGVDALGEQYALANDIPIEYYYANWDAHGNAAGPIRNTEMANNAEALILVWDGVSRGSSDMLQKATTKGLKIFTYIIKQEEPHER